MITTSKIIFRVYFLRLEHPLKNFSHFSPKKNPQITEKFSHISPKTTANHLIFKRAFLSLPETIKSHFGK
jgi:hypothetical protein